MARRTKREDVRCTRCGAESAWIEGTPRGTPPCDCVENIAENKRLRAETARLRSECTRIVAGYKADAVGLVQELSRLRSLCDAEGERARKAVKSLQEIVKWTPKARGLDDFDRMVQRRVESFAKKALRELTGKPR